jgi:guanyl-specific ribonuclease Sa
MKHWMMWTAGLSLVLGAMTAAPATAAEKAASSKPAASKPATVASAPTEEWAVTAITKEGGSFDYCAAGTRFDNKHALLIARNKADEIIVIVGLPTDKLKARRNVSTTMRQARVQFRLGSSGFF